MRSRFAPRYRILYLCAGFLLLLAPGHAVALAAPAEAQFWPAGAMPETWTGRLVRVDKHLALLTVRGSPEERGSAHGKLLGREVKALVDGCRKFLEHGTPRYAQCLEGARVMRGFVEADVLLELNACAKAAEVDAEDLLLAQLFGDVNRARGFRSFCTSFAAFGPATAGGKLLVGRNFDYAGHGLEHGLPIILQEIPKGGGAGRPFVTIGYAGILNGWTAMNADGLCASNNTLFEGVDKLEGMSTCFLLRKIVERATTLEDGVAVLEKTARSCTTGMLVAGRNKAGAWDGRLVEFDSKDLAVVEPREGVVLGSNVRQKLSGSNGDPAVHCNRFRSLQKNLAAARGVLSFDKPEQQTVDSSSVYMAINLHCALLDPTTQRIRLAVATGDGTPAGKNLFRTFRVKAEEIVMEP